VQTRTLHESFEGSKSSLACSRGELSRAAPAASGRLVQFLDFWAQRGFWAITLVLDMARRSIKSSVDANDYLASKKSLNQNFGSLDWRSGPVKVGQTCDNPNKIIFFNRN